VSGLAGKLPVRLLRKYVFSRIGLRDPDVIVGPSYGEDASVIKVCDGKVLVVHSDPITGAEKRLGWLAVHIPCNDIAVRGAKPRWLLPTLLLPEKTGEEVLDEITAQMNEAASEIGVMIVGGHTEYTVGIDRPLVAVTAMGLTDEDRYVKTSGAEPGDLVVMTKTAAVEGTAILASDMADLLSSKGVPEDVLAEARRYSGFISVVEEALTLVEVGVDAMHDPTEGGLLGGLAEMAHASGVLIEAWEDKIPVSTETKTICGALGIDPLKLISSGVVVAAIREDKVEEASSRLKKLGGRLTVIGRVVEGKGLKLYRSDGHVEYVGEFVEDELFKLLSKLKAGRNL